MNLDELLAAGEAEARKVIFEQRRQLPPSWILWDGQKMGTLSTPWANERERQLAKLFMRIQVKLCNTTAYSFVSEVWFANEPSDAPPGLEPRLRPDRQEMVFALATDGKIVRVKAWRIIRDWNDRIIQLEPERRDTEGASFSGWMATLLGNPKYEN